MLIKIYKHRAFKNGRPSWRGDLMKWFRMNEMSGSGERQVEKWLREDNGTIQEFDIDLYLGKKN